MTSNWQQIREEVLDRDNYACRICGNDDVYLRLRVRHIIPKKFGGDDSSDNLVTTCLKPFWCYEHTGVYNDKNITWKYNELELNQDPNTKFNFEIFQNTTHIPNDTIRYIMQFVNPYYKSEIFGLTKMPLKNLVVRVLYQS
jgi:hypothetical protein